MNKITATETRKIEIEFDVEDFWENLWGQGLYEEWFCGFAFRDGASWDTPTMGCVEITHWSADDEDKIVTTVLKFDDFTQAWAASIDAGCHHCGCSMADIEEADSCWADVVLQFAIYGELVYG